MERKKARRKRTGEKFHRKAKTTLHTGTRKKLTGKSSWFKIKPRDEEEERMKKKEYAERIESEDEREKNQKSGMESKKKDPKAVIFVPFTPGSALAKELREVEEMLEKLSGTRFKIVERAGIQLQRVISRTNPWAGSDCQREDCMVCETRLETGDNKGMACHRGAACMRPGVRHASREMRVRL